MNVADMSFSVLLVDDEPGIRTLLSKSLRAAGLAVEEAADGNQALAKLEQGHFHAVVTDIIMPDREGVETIIEIRRRWPGIFIVAMSGGGRVDPGEFLSLAEALGADRTLQKPFRPSELLALLPSPPRAMAQEQLAAT